MRNIILVTIFFLCSPMSLLSQGGDDYTGCQQACQLNGLSCVNRCMEQKRSASSQGQAGSQQNTVIVNNNNDGYIPVERDRLNRRDHIADGQPPVVNPPVAGQLPVRGGVAGGRGR